MRPLKLDFDSQFLRPLGGEFDDQTDWTPSSVIPCEFAWKNAGNG